MAKQVKDVLYSECFQSYDIVNLEKFINTLSSYKNDDEYNDYEISFYVEASGYEFYTKITLYGTRDETKFEEENRILREEKQKQDLLDRQRKQYEELKRLFEKEKKKFEDK